MCINRGEQMPFENVTKALYKKLEKVHDEIDRYETEREGLHEKVEEAKAQVKKAESLLLAKLDRLKKEAKELRDAMDYLSDSDG